MFMSVNRRGKGGGDSLHWTSFLFNTEKKSFTIPVSLISVQYIFFSFPTNYFCIAKEIRQTQFLFESYVVKISVI